MTLQWGAAKAEINGPSVENTELAGSPFKTRGRSYIAIHAVLSARDFFLAISTLLFHSPAFFLDLNLFQVFSVLAAAISGTVKA